MKKLIISSIITATFLFGSSGYSNSDNDAYKLYKCMIQNISPDAKRTMKQYSALTVVYTDKDLSALFKIDKKDVEKISFDAGRELSNLLVNKCKTELEDLFKDSPIPLAYNNFAKTLNLFITSLLSDSSQRDIKKLELIKEYLQKGLESNENFGKLLNKIFSNVKKNK